MSETERNPGPTRPDGDGFAVLSYLITGIGLFTVGGWALDRWLGTRLFVVLGALVGMGMSFYLIYLRYVKKS